MPFEKVLTESIKEQCYRNNEATCKSQHCGRQDAYEEAYQFVVQEAL